MSTQTEAMSKAGDHADEAAGSVVPEGLAEQLVAQAKAAGVALTGPGGLRSGLTKQVPETALNAEIKGWLLNGCMLIYSTGVRVKSPHGSCPTALVEFYCARGVEIELP